jgi:hypothetical protein
MISSKSKLFTRKKDPQKDINRSQKKSDKNTIAEQIPNEVNLGDPQMLVQLQRVMGNQAIQRIIDNPSQHGKGCTCPACGMIRLQRESAANIKEGTTQGDKIQRALSATMDKQTFIDTLVGSVDARSKKDHIPSTGLGRFDAEYNPTAGQLTIRIRVLFDFGDKDPASPTFKSGLGNWTDDERKNFILSFKNQAEAAWSGKYLINCIKPGWDDLKAKVKIVLDPARTIDTAHFHHQIAKNQVIGTGIGREQSKDRNQKNVGNFMQKDATVGPQKASVCSGIASHDKGRMDNIITAAKVNPIRFTAANEIDDTSKGKLDLLVAMMNRTERPGSVPVPFIAYGFDNKRERFKNIDGAMIRANKVKQYLTGKLQKNPVNVDKYQTLLDAAEEDYKGTNRKDVRKEKKAAFDLMNANRNHRQVELKADDNFSWTGDPYSVLAHEFGHMLGNPDEYFAYGSEKIRDAKAKQLASTGNPEDMERAIQVQATDPSGTKSHAEVQEPMGDLAEKAGQQIPEFGPKTSSIMSAGTDVLPVHYVTMWEVLGEITKDAIKPEEWKIG